MRNYLFQKFNLVAIVFILMEIFIIPSKAGLLPDDKEDYEIAAECKQLFPNLLWDFFNRSECIDKKKQKQEEAQKNLRIAEAKRVREDKARSCIADDLPRIEADLEAIKKSFRNIYDKKHEDLNISRASDLVTQFDQSIKPSIEVPDEDFKQKVLVFELKTKCDSDFHYLANLRFGRDGIVRWLKFWSLNRPRGTNTLDMDFSDASHEDDYENERKKLEKEAYEKRMSEKREEETRRNIEAAENQKILKEISDMISREDRLKKVARVGEAGYLVAQNNKCKVWDAEPQEAETVIWNGQCLDGVATGIGEAEFSFISNGQQRKQRLQGTFIDGAMGDGTVKIIDMLGWSYTGAYKNGKMDRFGEFKFQDGKTSYQGLFVNGLPDGQGVYFHPDYIYPEKISSVEVFAKHGCIWSGSIHIDPTLVKIMGQDNSEAKCKVFYKP